MPDVTPVLMMLVTGESLVPLAVAVKTFVVMMVAPQPLVLSAPRFSISRYRVPSGLIR